MSEIIESNDVVEEATTPIKKPRGRPRKPEEEKKRKDKPPRVKKERHHEEKAPLKTGRKKGQIANPERYLPNGTYSTKPLDPDYHKKYYREVVRFTGVVCCDICKATLANKQGLGKHQKTQYCRRKAYFQTIPDISALLPEKVDVECQNVASE